VLCSPGDPPSAGCQDPRCRRLAIPRVSTRVDSKAGTGQDGPIRAGRRAGPLSGYAPREAAGPAQTLDVRLPLPDTVGRARSGGRRRRRVDRRTPTARRLLRPRSSGGRFAREGVTWPARSSLLHSATSSRFPAASYVALSAAKERRSVVGLAGAPECARSHVIGRGYQRVDRLPVMPLERDGAGLRRASAAARPLVGRSSTARRVAASQRARRAPAPASRRPERRRLRRAGAGAWS